MFGSGAEPITIDSEIVYVLAIVGLVVGYALIGERRIDAARYDNWPLHVSVLMALIILVAGGVLAWAVFTGRIAIYP